LALADHCSRAIEKDADEEHIEAQDARAPAAQLQAQ
jgi:hypothetical protein